MERPSQMFDGKLYVLDSEGRYLTYSGKRLHREVWKKHFGEIPKGYVIHHIDGDRLNNRIENLQCLSASEHTRIHMQDSERKEKMLRSNKERWQELDAARREWAKTPEGKRWYQEHWKESIGKMKPIEKKCAACGKTFLDKSGGHGRYCSQNCKMKARRRRLKGLPENIPTMPPGLTLSKYMEDFSIPTES